MLKCFKSLYLTFKIKTMKKLIVDIKPLSTEDIEMLKNYLDDYGIEYSEVSMPPDDNSNKPILPDNAFQEMEE